MPEQDDDLDSLIVARDAGSKEPAQLADIALGLWSKLQQAREHQQRLDGSEQALAAHDQTVASQLSNALGTREELSQAIQAIEAGLDLHLDRLKQQNIERHLDNDTANKLKTIQTMRAREAALEASRREPGLERDTYER